MKELSHQLPVLWEPKDNFDLYDMPGGICQVSKIPEDYL